MRTKVEISGIMTDLPADNVPQGACQEIVNLRYVDGAWRPVSSKKIDWEHTGDVKQMYIHQIEGFQINIVYIGSQIYYLDYTAATSTYSYTGFTFSSSPTIGSSRNLRFSSFNQVLFIQDVATGFVYITKLTISGSEYSYSEVLRWDYCALPKLKFYSSFTKTYRKFFTTLEDYKNVAKAAYQSLEDEAKNNNHFCNRIFVRYALKMFDGSYIKHSSIFPVYYDSTSPSPYIQNYGRDTNNGGDPIQFKDADSNNIDNPFDVDDKISSKHSITLAASLLRFSVPSDISGSDNATLISNLKKFKDYIVSLDIFVSDTDEIWDIDNIPIALEFQGTASYDPYITDNSFSLNIPNNSDDFEKLNNFYLFKSIPIDNLQIGEDDSLGFIKFEGIDYNYSVGDKSNELFRYSGDKSRFTSRKVLPINDYAHTAVGNKVLTYNSRLFLGNVVERLFNGYPSLLLCERGSAYTGSYSYQVHVFVYIETEEGEKIVQGNSYFNWFDNNYKFYLAPFLTYPDIRAKKIAIYCGTTGSYYGYEFKTKVHPYLNLAYAFTGTDNNAHYSTWREINPYTTTALTTLPTTTTSLFNDRNRLMVSRINNPFVFPAEDTNNVGKNDIVGLLTNAKQLSEGQFGLHPVIILTRGGVWSIQIGTGSIFTKNIVPLSSDECTGEAICFYSRTLNSDVIVYLSRTGVKFLQGTQVIDITQYVKRTKLSALDFIGENGYTDVGSIADGLSLSVGEYGELTAGWSIFSTGDWILKVATTGTVAEQYTKLDKSYWFFTNFDNYIVPKADEKTGWSNAAYQPSEV